MQINLIWDSFSLAAPQSFRDSIQSAATLLDATFGDNVTINIKVGYGEYPGDGSAEQNGGASAGPANGTFVAYSTVRSWLASNAATEVQSGVSALPAGGSIQGQSNVVVWRAQVKLMGLVSANDVAVDGYAGFASDISTGLLKGVALHELTHAMGRVPYGSAPDIFDLFRFTGTGNRYFSGGLPASASYFSLNNGATDLADFGQNSDPSDFLSNSGRTPNDPFNEFYNPGTVQSLTNTDILLMESEGFHKAGTNSAPDLIVTSLTTGSASVVQGAALSFSYTEANSGNAAAGLSWSAWQLDNAPTAGSYLGYDYETLTAGGSQSATHTLDTSGLSVGQHTLWLGADVGGSISESNENNNTNSIIFNVTAPAGKPDLAISALTAASASVVQGAALSFSYTEANSGNAAAGLSWSAWQLDNAPTAGSYLGYDYETLTAGGSQSATHTLDTSGLSVGQHTLWLGADVGGSISESNENNNTNSIIFNVTAPAGKPDLAISALTAASASVVQGAALSFSYTEANSGNAAAGLSWSAWQLDNAPTAGSYLGYDYETLAAGGSQSATHTLDTSGLSVGQHTLWLGADVGGSISESNENNNTNSIIFNVTAPAGKPDLAISALTAASASVVQGAALSFSYTEANFGNAAAGLSWSAWQLDNAPTAGSYLGYDYETLTAGGSQSATHTLDTSGLSVGQHTLWLGADVGGSISESNENNNTNSIIFNVTAPVVPNRLS